MIRLKDLITEISLASVSPYANQFVWTDRWGDGESWECKFVADSQPITMTMMWWKSSAIGDEGEWQFAYFVRTKDDNGWTTTASNGAAQGAANIFRLFKTIGAALRDFADTHANVDVIDVTGSDNQPGKSQQKTHIYIEFLRTNPDLREFNILQGSTRLYLVRKDIDTRQADATGIEDSMRS
jgi:hypothetical protein